MLILHSVYLKNIYPKLIVGHTFRVSAFYTAFIRNSI